MGAVDNLRAVGAGNAYSAQLEASDRAWNDEVASVRQSIKAEDVLNELIEDYEGSLDEAGDNAEAIGSIYLVAKERLVLRMARRSFGIAMEARHG